MGFRYYLLRRNVLSLLRPLFLGATLFLNPDITQAVEIIVNNSVPAVRYSLDEVRAIFIMRLTQWPNGNPIQVFVLPDGHPVHKSFAKNKLNMFPHQLRSAWNRLVYSGTGVAPTQVLSQEAMLQAISNTPNSIGYLDSKPDNTKVHLLDYQ
jgi:ABC-type phosphate transport system substrate-binding protein